MPEKGKQFKSGLSPNQFALPGMEGDAHPLAGYAAKGYEFHEREERKPHAEPGFHMARHTHSLGATHPDQEPLRTPSEGFPGNPDKAVAELHWRGQHHAEGYPGEIEWVQRTGTAPGSGGITDAMHAFASRGGKSTVPVHSIDRSDEGDEWARRVGPKHLTPASMNEIQNAHPDDNDGAYEKAYERAQNWSPPAGTHPYESSQPVPRAVHPAQLALAGIGRRKKGEVSGAVRRIGLESEYHDEHPLKKPKQRRGYPPQMPQRPRAVPPSFD